MPEPFEEAEARELAWDRHCASAPRCSCCGGSVYPHDVFFEYDDIVLCEKCLGAYIHSVDDLEV